MHGRLVEEESGRCVDVSTTECALIVYTSNWVDEEPPFVPVLFPIETDLQHYAICLEPGFYPDTPNHPSFPTSVILPGHSYYHHSVFKFSTLFCVCFSSSDFWNSISSLRTNISIFIFASLLFVNHAARS